MASSCGRSGCANRTRACSRSPVAHSEAGRLAAAGKHDLAEQWLADWQRHTGERLHLELTRTQRDGEDAFNALRAARLGARAASRSSPATTCASSTPTDFDAHEARVCISTGRVLDDPKRPRDYSAEQYLKSSDEMEALFADVPDAIDNAVALATRCNLELSLGTYYLPAFPVPGGRDARQLDPQPVARRPGGAPGEASRRRRTTARDDYDARLETELDVIVKMGFAGYFLIVADFINWAKDNDIPVGPGPRLGRRLAGGLGARASPTSTRSRYDLLFERFLNPERVSMPDFDIDFCMDRRDEVIDYVAAKYGRDRVSQIITYGTMAAKAVRARHRPRARPSVRLRRRHRQAHPADARRLARRCARRIRSRAQGTRNSRRPN